MGGDGVIDHNRTSHSSGRAAEQPRRLTQTLCSFLLLGLPAAVFWLIFGRGLLDSRVGTSPSSEGQTPEAELTRFCPDDPMLASRLATQWAYFARRVAEHEGGAGLRTLDIFGDDAIYLFEKDRAAFNDLKVIVDLDGSLYSASTGPWRKAVVEWAMSGKLRAYHDYLERLQPPELEQLRRIPCSLPLLGQDAPFAKQMLKKYGLRAWHLFMLLDFSETGAGGVERVARCLAKDGEQMLDLNERYGLAVALLLVPPPDDPGDRLPELFRRAMRSLCKDEAAALFLTNYDDLATILLREARPFDDLAEVFDMLAAQPPELRAFALDGGHVIRLLLEKRGDEHIGLRVLKRCGPTSADEIFERGRYSVDPVDRDAALLIMSHNGWDGLGVLHELHGWGPWHQLLRRADLKSSKNDPLLCRLARKIAQSPGKQDEIEAWLKMPVDQIESLQYPPAASEKALEWLPGFLAAKAVSDLSKGHYLDKSTIGWAVFDGFMSASMVGKLAGQAVKTVGRQAVKESVTELERKAAVDAISELERQAARELVSQGSNQSMRTLMRRLPGAALSFVRALPDQLLKIDVTQVMRSASGVAKRVGVRTWGKLDRRIIMRGDRRVLVDLSNPDFLKTLGEQARSELLWDSVGFGVGEIGPCILERVIPALRGG